MPFDIQMQKNAPSPPSRPSRTLSGRGVLLALLLFFGAMMVANIALVYSALSTLPGGELENAYDASQGYNKAIANARQQEERGWNALVSTRAEGDGARVTFELRDRSGALVSDARVLARFEHPADHRVDQSGALALVGASYEGVVHNLHAGLWTLVIEVSSGGENIFVTRNRVVLGSP